jgi:small conductance mechanosensitive channel
MRILLSSIYLFIGKNQAPGPVDSLNLDIAGAINTIEHTPIQTLLLKAGTWLGNFSLKLAICIALIWLGKKVIGKLSAFLCRAMDRRRRADRTVTHFMINLLKVIYWLIIVWILISILGINTSSVVALFASAGLAFGLALSGTLQNFAGGVMILLFKPFRTGDYISSQGEEGTVTDITIINTILITPDNRTIYLPNGATFTGIVRNTSGQKTRRVEWLFSIGYANDYDLAKVLLLKLIDADSRILKTPAPFIALNRLGQSSVEIVVRVWTGSDDFWGVFYDMNEAVYKTFPINELGQPSPQMDVYLHPPKEAENGSPGASPAVPPSAPASTQAAAKAAVADAESDLEHIEHHCDASAKPSGGESGK